MGKHLFSKCIWNKVIFKRIFIKGNDKRLQIKRMLNYDSYRKPFTVSYLLSKLPWFDCIYRLNSTAFFICILIFTLTFPGPSWNLPCKWGGLGGAFFIQIRNLTAWLWEHYSFSLFGNRKFFLKSFLKIKKKKNIYIYIFVSLVSEVVNTIVITQNLFSTNPTLTI